MAGGAIAARIVERGQDRLDAVLGIAWAVVQALDLLDGAHQLDPDLAAARVQDLLLHASSQLRRVMRRCGHPRLEAREAACAVRYWPAAAASNALELRLRAVLTHVVDGDLAGLNLRLGDQGYGPDRSRWRAVPLVLTSAGPPLATATVAHLVPATNAPADGPLRFFAALWAVFSAAGLVSALTARRPPVLRRLTAVPLAPPLVPPEPPAAAEPPFDHASGGHPPDAASHTVRHSLRGSITVPSRAAFDDTHRRWRLALEACNQCNAADPQGGCTCGHRIDSASLLKTVDRLADRARADAKWSVRGIVGMAALVASAVPVWLALAWDDRGQGALTGIVIVVVVAAALLLAARAPALVRRWAGIDAPRPRTSLQRDAGFLLVWAAAISAVLLTGLAMAPLPHAEARTTRACQWASQPTTPPPPAGQGRTTGASQENDLTAPWRELVDIVRAPACLRHAQWPWQAGMRRFSVVALGGVSLGLLVVVLLWEVLGRAITGYRDRHDVAAGVASPLVDALFTLRNSGVADLADKQSVIDLVDRAAANLDEILLHQLLMEGAAPRRELATRGAAVVDNMRACLAARFCP